MLTDADRQALMLDAISRGKTVALCTSLDTLSERVNDVVVGVPTDQTGAEVQAGTPGATERLQIKLLRETNESRVRDMLRETALAGEPTQYAVWHCSGLDYPLIQTGDAFLHRGVQYRILRLLESEAGDTVVSCALICDVES